MPNQTLPKMFARSHLRRRLNHWDRTQADSDKTATTSQTFTSRSKPELMVREASSLRLTKLLLKVTIERSVGPVQVVAAPDSTVGDLVKAALEIYFREKRRPLLNHSDPGSFQLHYSQFCLESLRREEKLINLGSRSFFLCSNSKPSSGCTSLDSCCSQQANKRANSLSLFLLTKLMNFWL